MDIHLRMTHFRHLHKPEKLLSSSQMQATVPPEWKADDVRGGSHWGEVAGSRGPGIILICLRVQDVSQRFT